jgi:hypothetical protein
MLSQIFSPHTARREIKTILTNPYTSKIRFYADRYKLKEVHHNLVWPHSFSYHYLPFSLVTHNSKVQNISTFKVGYKY